MITRWNEVVLHVDLQMPKTGSWTKVRGRLQTKAAEMQPRHKHTLHSETDSCFVTQTDILLKDAYQKWSDK